MILEKTHTTENTDFTEKDFGLPIFAYLTGVGRLCGFSQAKSSGMDFMVSSHKL
jgi:hypothetical protein